MLGPLDRALPYLGHRLCPLLPPPPSSADLCHTAAILPEKDHWATGPRPQPVLGRPLETYTNPLTHLHRPPQPPAPCPSHSSPHVLSRSYPSIKQKPCRESFFTRLSLWPKTLMKVEQILLAEVDQPIYWCPGPKSPRLVP